MSADTGRYIAKIGLYDFRVISTAQAFDFLNMMEEGRKEDAFNKWYANSVSFECLEMAEAFALSQEEYDPTEYGVHYLGDFSQYGWRKQ